jgi:anti-sigma regulatory factor (Ser/Thr protein kinase)
MDRRIPSPRTTVMPAPACRSTVLEAPASVQGPGVLRSQVGKILTKWGQEDLADRVMLTVSELLTNALLHGRTESLILRLDIEGCRLRLSVPDANPAPPNLALADADDENGRGICLVAAFADAWGFRATDSGKCVFAEFSTSST